MLSVEQKVFVVAGEHEIDRRNSAHISYVLRRYSVNPYVLTYSELNSNILLVSSFDIGILVQPTKTCSSPEQFKRQKEINLLQNCVNRITAVNQCIELLVLTTFTPNPDGSQIVIPGSTIIQLYEDKNLVEQTVLRRY